MMSCRRRSLRVFLCLLPLGRCSSAARGGAFGGAGGRTSAPRKRAYPAAFAAGGGFGASSSSKKPPLRRKKKGGGGGNNNKNAKRRDELKDAAASAAPPPALDRFGLPVPTVDDVFPPLPADAEVIPAPARLYDGDGATDWAGATQGDLDAILEHHLPVRLSALREGCRRRQSQSSPGGGEGEEMKARILHVSPPVIAIDNFFTPEECQEYMYMVMATDKSKNGGGDEKKGDGAGGASAPMEVRSATFSPLAQSKRTSTTWYCHYRQVPTLLAKVTRLLDVPLERCEEAQVVRYRTGEEFSWHVDEVPPPQLTNGGQRVATLLVYLNTPGEGGGGATAFRDLTDPSGKERLAMTPRRGSLLIFFPAFADGRPDDRTLHRGEVAVDEKMIAQMWIHERDYRPVIPEGNSHEEARPIVAEREAELGLS